MLQGSYTKKLSIREYNFIRDLLLDKTGIDMSDQKAILVEGRLTKRLSTLNLSNFSEYINLLKNDKTNTELKCFINQLTTNKTSFFRERVQLDYLSELCEKSYKHDTVYIWSAACSTGEEAYSLAIMLEDIKHRHTSFDYKILGTDIDTNCVKTAQEGVYEIYKTKSLSALQSKKFLLRGGDVNADKLKICDQIKKNIKFRSHNLIEYDSQIPLKFHFIFLRNVMIYFTDETIELLIKKMENHLHPNGLLFVGLSESLRSIDTNLKNMGNCIYQKSKME